MESKAMSQLKLSTILQKYSFHLPNLPSRLKCVLCHSILKNSKQTSCGCKVCEECITDYLSSGPKPCPNNQPDCVDRLTMVDILQDNATNREIGNLTVDCPFESCTFSSTLKNMVEHIDKCEFREIECEKCKERIKKTDQEKHFNECCRMRMDNCPFCNKEMIFEYFNSVHLNPDSDQLCSKYKSICPNKCQVKEEVVLREHLKGCPNKKLECPFHSLTCEIDNMSKEGLTIHLQRDIISHSSSLVNIFRQIETKLNNISSGFKIVTEMDNELCNIQNKSSESFDKLKKTVEESKKQIVPSIQIVDNKNEIFRNGNFIWKFTDFEIRRIEAESGGRVSVTSDPFYTSEFGYKMCLRVYPAGDGVGKGSYLSVFFAIMKGEYDDLLQWPFKQKVTLTLFDLESGTKNHSETFKPDTRSICYQKPTEECNIASGSPRFISLSQLSSSSKYCKNDTIFIKASIDQIGINKA